MANNEDSIVLSILAGYESCFFLEIDVAALRSTDGPNLMILARLGEQRAPPFLRWSSAAPAVSLAQIQNVGPLAASKGESKILAGYKRLPSATSF